MPVISDNLTLRVILAGRTGLEGTLRRDPGIELIRARTALEALGELSDPIDGESPERTVVIVGGDVVAAVSTRELHAAVKVLMPGAVTLLAAEAPSRDAALDGTIAPGSDAATLRALLAGPAQPLASQVAHAPSPTRTPERLVPTGYREVQLPSPPGPPSKSAAASAERAPVVTSPGRITQQVVFVGDPLPGHASAESQLVEPPMRIAPPVQRAVVVQAPPPLPPQSDPVVTTPAARAWPGKPEAHAAPADPHRPSTLGTWSWNDERLMVQALLDDREVLEAGLEAIRRRVGRADVTFVSNQGPPGPRGAAVTHDGRTLGFLASVSLDAHHLEQPATWLAHWVTLQAHLREARRSSITDDLTGAFNRRYLDRFLETALRESAHKRHMLSVMIFDIDHFKIYNDRYGHSAGDEILVETVKLLRSVIRPDDRVCRVGGDEFVVVFYEPAGPREPGTRHPASVELIAERFRRQIAEHRFPKLGEEAAGRLTISAGLATFPWDGLSGADLLKAADANLYKSKRDGRNAISFGR